MHLHTLDYIYIATICLAFLSSLVYTRLDTTLHLWIFSLLLGLNLANEGLAWWRVSAYKTTISQYNGFMLLEFSAYAGYYYLIIQSPFTRKIIKGFLWLYPIFWAVDVFAVVDIDNRYIYLCIVGGIFTVIFSLAYYFQLFTEPKLVRLDRTPEFWIATGLILVYTCSLPFIGMHVFLMTNHLPRPMKLNNMMEVLRIIMYCIFIYAFLCRINSTKSGSY